jgi:broad specificity phosphatase PhoE
MSTINEPIKIKTNPLDVKKWVKNTNSSNSISSDSGIGLLSKNSSSDNGLTKINYDKKKTRNEEVKLLDPTVERPSNDLTALNDTDLNTLNEFNALNQPVSDYICLIVSHNNRIQCFVDKLLNKMNTDRKIRFRNAAILCLTINLVKHGFELELVYDGELSPKEQKKVSLERPYYTKEVIDSNNSDINDGIETFTKINGDINKLNLLREDMTDLKKKLKSDKLVFYIVRHGQAEHNEPGYNLQAKAHLQLDTSITQLGKEQAVNAAINLARILNLNGQRQHINEVFVSDLQRTWQTAGPFFENQLTKTDTIIVDPCASEIETQGDGTGNCDTKSGNKNVLQKLHRENYPSTAYKEGITFGAQAQTINIERALYSTFYKNKIRGYSNLNDIPNCKSTNMISMAVYYLLNKNKIVNKSNITPLNPENVINSDEAIANADDANVEDDDDINENENEGTNETVGGKTKKRKYNQRTKRNNKKIRRNNKKRTKRNNKKRTKRNNKKPKGIKRNI